MERHLQLLDDGVEMQILDDNLLDGGDSVFQDDFDRMIEMREESGFGADGQILDDIDQMTNQEEIERQENLKEAAPVRNVPPSWLRSGREGLLNGEKVTVTSGGGSVDLLRWNGDSLESQVVTVTIGVSNMRAQGTWGMATGVLNRPYAVVVWGTRNATNQAIVDVGKGCQFSLSCSSLYLLGGLDSGGTAGSMELCASLSLLGAPRLAPATRTVYQGSIAAATTTSANNVPAFAKQLLPIQRAFALSAGVATPAAVTVTFRDIAANIVAQIYGNDTLYTIMSSPMPLPNDAYDFIIRNEDAALTIPSMRFIFELAL